MFVNNVVCISDWIVGQGHYCEANFFNFLATADRLCGRDLYCGTCPEQPNINKCLGVGNGKKVYISKKIQ